LRPPDRIPPPLRESFMTQVTHDQAIAIAMAHLQSGRLAEAETIYRHVLAQQPDSIDALHGLGQVAIECRHPEAVGIMRNVIARRPDSPDALADLAAALQQSGNYLEATRHLQRAISLRPNFPKALVNLGNGYLAMGQHAAAIGVLREAIELRPGFAEAYYNIGTALGAIGQVDEAIAAYQQAVAWKPSLAPAHSNLGNLLQLKGQNVAALGCYERALAYSPNYSEAWTNLGNALTNLGRLDEAAAAHRKAIQQRPDFTEAHYNLGVAHLEQMKVPEAIACFRRALELRPDYPEAHNNLSMLLLLTGEFAEGWQEYEWRWKVPGFPSPTRHFSQPAWTGGPAPAGADTILIHAEQGLGDTVQFVRYVPLVKKLGWRIVLECMQTQGRLLSDAAEELGIDQIVTRTEDGPIEQSDAALPTFDVHLPLLSLPRTLNLLDPADPAIPRPPYLKADEALVARFRDEPLLADAGAFKVGLIWAGRPTHRADAKRSMPLAELAPLAMSGVRLYSLQFGAAADQMQVAPQGMGLTDLTPLINDFADTAACLTQLDLLIAVDTASVHLAGALGLPAWAMIAFVPDFRWIIGRDDTPWYPSVHLYRQERPGDWSTVVRAVAADLERAARAATPVAAVESGS